MPRLFDWLNDPQRVEKIYNARLNAEFDGVYAAILVIQVIQATYVANADLTAAIPLDDTPPLISEGTEIISQAITPADNTNKILVEFSGLGATSGNDNLIAAIFRGSTCIHVAAARSATSNTLVTLAASILDSPASASAQTYSVRVGPDAGTARMNGTTSGRLFGGAAVTTLILTEILA